MEREKDRENKTQENIIFISLYEQDDKAKVREVHVIVIEYALGDI